MYPPNAKLALINDPAVEPLDLADAKNFLKVDPDNTEDDDLIRDLIAAARLDCEMMTDRSFITTTWQLTLDYLPMGAGPFLGLPWPFATSGGGGGYGRVYSDDGRIQLPMPPLLSLESLTYLDQAGTLQAVDVSPQSRGVIVSPGTPGWIAPAFGTFFPLSQARPAAVTITYTAGYGPDASTVPRNVVQAIRILTAHSYYHRTLDAPIPQAVERLLRRSQWGSYA